MVGLRALLNEPNGCWTKPTYHLGTLGGLRLGGAEATPLGLGGHFCRGMLRLVLLATAGPVTEWWRLTPTTRGDVTAAAFPRGEVQPIGPWSELLSLGGLWGLDGRLARELEGETTSCSFSPQLLWGRTHTQTLPSLLPHHAWVTLLDSTTRAPDNESFTGGEKVARWEPS